MTEDNNDGFVAIFYYSFYRIFVCQDFLFKSFISSLIRIRVDTNQHIMIIFHANHKFYF